MKEVTVTREKLFKLMQDQQGRFFSVVFRKKDNTLRKINGRLGVKKYLKGGKNMVVRYDNPYETTFDVHSMGYRTVNLHTVCSVFANNYKYTVLDEEVL
jgi:hypothetical protein